MADIDNMTLRERTAGLMRGNREELQLGYTAPNAAYAALRYERLRQGITEEPATDDPVLTGDLIPYAEGFADGMADTLEGFRRAQPTAALLMDSEELEKMSGPYERHSDQVTSYAGAGENWAAYEDGRADGQKEFAPRLYPALKRKPKPDYIQRFPERT